MRIQAAVLVGLALLARTGAAQLTEKQADAAVRSVAKQARADHAAAVQQRTAAVLAAVDVFSAAAPTGVGVAFAGLFEDVEVYQNGLFSDFRVVHSIAIDAVIAALDDFAQAVPLLGDYPEEFHFGHGGALDDLRASMQAAQAKSLAKVRKKLAKAAGKLAQASDARLASHLELATTQGNDGFIQGTSTGYTRTPLAIHTALALGFVGSPDSGTLLVGGLGESTEAISVRAVGEEGLEAVAADFFELGSPFWHVTIDDQGAGMPDGNYLVVAQQDTAGTSFGAFVSVK
jgi:hypothetical protein